MGLIWNRTVDWSETDWRDRSACRTADPSLFFPAGSGHEGDRQVAEAKKVCATCPVTSDCLEFALRANQVAGVWGGTSEEERRRIRRQWLAARRRPAVAG